MNDTVVNASLVLIFVLVGGVFAATEIALVSLREGQIRRLQRRGSRGARAAALARDPNRFLSAVQIGVTVARIPLRRLRRLAPSPQPWCPPSNRGACRPGPPPRPP